MDQVNWEARAARLLNLGFSLKQQIGKRRNDKRAKEGTGLFAQLDSIEDELRLLMTERGLSRIQTDDIVFECSIQGGRSKVSFEAFKKELLLREVDRHLIREAEEAARKTGSASWKRKWKKADEEDEEETEE